MDEILRQIAITLRGMWQRRWIGLGVAWLVGMVAAVLILRMPDRYEASARIYVDTQSVLKPLMSGLAVQPNVEQQIAILSRTLISRPNVEKLVRMADLDLSAKTREEQEQLVDGLMRTLQISRAGGDNLYTLAYRDTQPERAKRVVQSLVQIFVESSLGGKRKDSDTAKRFIEDQIKVYEKKLEEAENRLKDFKLRHMNLASADGKDYYGKTAEVAAALSQAKLDLREAENSRDALKRQLAGEEPIFLPEPADTTPTATMLPEIDGRLETLKRNLDNLRLRFTDEHPDVLAAKRLISDLEFQRERELGARTSKVTAKKAAPVNSNPVYQQLKVSLAEAEANVASLQTRVNEYDARLAGLRQSAKMVPQIEAELAQLNRDYDINKRNYEALVGRRESAEISGEMEAASGVADFRLVDPPRVSPQPVAPNRLLLYPIALLAALGGGLIASFAASQIWPTFFDSSSLRHATGLPVLGTVSLVVTDSLRRRERRNLIGFATGCTALLGSFAVGLVLLLMRSGRIV